ncbi:uncharacterized protein [Labrus bergylta]|uniref:uncharacterized protein n=1 Tax=Labrus bergylta TaxID=56723 RepID=UPI0033139536
MKGVDGILILTSFGHRWQQNKKSTRLWVMRSGCHACGDSLLQGFGPLMQEWNDLYLKIDKCPMQRRGQASLFGGPQTCGCGFHTKKPSSSVPDTPFPCTTVGTGQGQGPSSAAAAAAASSASTSAGPVQRPALNLAMFTKPRFGGSHGAALKPNLTVARKPAKPLISTSTSTTTNFGTATPTSGRTSSPAQSPRKYIRTSSPFSLPPTPVSSASIIPPATAAVVTAAPSSASSDPSVCASSTTPGPDPLSNMSAEDVLAAPGPDLPWLPVKMRKTIPLQDQRWISAALWRNQRLRTDMKLWYEPPGPALIYHQAPTPQRFFNHHLLVWMPYHLWKVRLTCPVCGKQLVGYGAHKRARQVLDVDRYYLIVTETLRCNSIGCKTNYLSSSKTILDQLDLAHRLEFRLILTQKYACDIRVIRFLRERTLGNSPSRLVKQLRENHSEEWLQRLCQYLGACSDFVGRPSLFPVVPA